MPHDAAKVEEAREWLRRAKADLDSAQLLLTGPPAHPDTALSTVNRRQKKPGKRSCSGMMFPSARPMTYESWGRPRKDWIRPWPSAERAEELTPFAWAFRYPGEPVEPSGEEAAEALALAHEVSDSVQATPQRGSTLPN